MTLKGQGCAHYLEKAADAVTMKHLREMTPPVSNGHAADDVTSDAAAPQIWNHIPTAIKVSPSLDSFKRQ